MIMTSNHPTDTSEHRHSAARMRAIRKALGLTQRDWAYYLRVAVPTVSNWETGRTKPSGLAVAAIRTKAVELGLDLNTLRKFPE